jgi:hypothetical protein
LTSVLQERWLLILLLLSNALMLKIKLPAKTNANGEEERLLLETKIFQTYLMHY